MGQLLLILAVALVVGAVVFGVAVLITGSDRGLSAAEPDGQAVPLPTHRPLEESDVDQVRFDTALRGYRMAQVDHALRRAAYDIGYKDELINVLEAEVAALRTGRAEDAEILRRAREAAVAGTGGPRETVPDPGSGAPPAVVDLGLMSRASEAEAAPEAEPAESPEPADDVDTHEPARDAAEGEVEPDGGSADEAARSDEAASSDEAARSDEAASSDEAARSNEGAGSAAAESSAAPTASGRR